MKNLKVKQKGKYELEKPFWLTKIKLVKNAFNIHALTIKIKNQSPFKLSHNLQYDFHVCPKQF